MAHGGERRAVIAALLANLGIAVAKFAGFAITGAASLLAAAIHSVADTSNQGLLLLGDRRARRGRARRSRRPGWRDARLRRGSRLATRVGRVRSPARVSKAATPATSRADSRAGAAVSRTRSPAR